MTGGLVAAEGAVPAAVSRVGKRARIEEATTRGRVGAALMGGGGVGVS